MVIEVKGTNSLRKKNLVEESTRFFCYNLLPRSWDKLHISVYFESGLLKENNCFADCIHCDYTNVRPKVFDINIDKGLTKVNLITTLAHECIHIQQYASGRLIDYIKEGNKYCKWNGKRYQYYHLSYNQYPWEKEAFEWEAWWCGQYLKLYK